MEANDCAIRAQNLGKCYQIYGTPRDRLRQFVIPRLQRLARQTPRQYFREFWALHDVSFEVRKGETVGIVGRNGSGKSTLLQIICGTLTPTRGTVTTNGRIAALLELGSGFNPNFTGRENVYMNGAVLGLSKAELDARYDGIAAFADIGDFIEQPVKTYSSGMVVRLAFAVAINVDPQILVVDEALSVGDELFRRKCFSRIEAIKSSGATILFVSHAGATVVELCDRAILLDDGELLASGTPKSVVGRYQKLLYAPEDKREEIRNEIKTVSNPSQVLPPRMRATSISTQSAACPRAHAPEDFFDPHLKPQSTLAYEPHGAVIENPRILNVAGDPVNCLKRGRTYRYTYTVHFTEGASSVRFGMLIKTLSGMELGGATSAQGAREAMAYVAPGSAMRVEFRFQCNLNQGTYFLNAGIMGIRNTEETYLHRLLDACMFRVLPCEDNLATGIVDFNCMPDIIFLSDSESTVTA
ncbi:MAG: ABC transporter ATP-binding protein [Gammaproteobacteria bacterium]|nr:ABC transporter ATP-binding protein [Gammaproteobacteria bacterium]